MARLSPELGKEVALPKGISFLDADGHARTESRSRWYLPPRHGMAAAGAQPARKRCKAPETTRRSI
jgi:hypothetical protein